MRGARVTSTPDRSDARLTLVVGDGCHLCDHGREVLSALGIPVREVRVDSPEAAAIARGGVLLAILPVLTDGTRVLAYGRLSARRLARELRA